MPTPRKPVPPLSLPLVGGGRFDLDDDPGASRGTLVCVYRGFHCPICVTYLKALDAIVPALAERGVTAVALSTDPEDRAVAMAERVAPKALRFAHGFTLQQARDWGLYLSTGRGRTSMGVEEPAIFAEPGLFLVSPGRALYFASIQTMPFLRPDLAELPARIDFIVEKSYPARGEYTGPI